MNFAAFKEFKKTPDTNLKNVIDYLNSELNAIIRELRVGLNKVTFEENFESFESVLTIPASTEVAIRNELSVIPTKWITVRTNEYGLSVCDGSTPWTLNYLYLKNTAATEAQLTVLFLK